MRYFGVAAGLAGFSRLLFLHQHGLALAVVLAVWAAILLVINAGLFVVLTRPRLPGSVWEHPDAAYIGWGVIAVLLLGGILPGLLGAVVWLVGVGAGVRLLVAGAPQLWRDRATLDMGHVGWCAWVLVAALTAPRAVPAAGVWAAHWAGLAMNLTVTVLAAVALVRNKTFSSTRSPWFGVGGACGTAAGFLQTPLVAAPLLALALVWMIPVLHIRPVGRRASWPNLFPLSNITLFAWAAGALGFVWAAIPFAIWVGALETRDHTRALWRAWRETRLPAAASL